MNQPFYATFWFWGLIFLAFLGIIFFSGNLETELQSQYARHKMRLLNVKFDELEAGFAHATMYADEVEMDDSQNNMTASGIHAFFFDRDTAGKRGELTAAMGMKSPFEAKLWGDVRIVTSAGERFRGEEVRYIFSRNEIFASVPVTIWKDDMIITGRELRYNVKTKEGSIARDVLIRIWDQASGTTSAASIPAALKKTQTLSAAHNSVVTPLFTLMQTVQRVASMSFSEIISTGVGMP